MIVQFVKFTSGLSEDEARRTIAERAPRYRELSGLIQKLYVRDRETGEYGGIYVWDDEASLSAFRDSELAKTIPEAYEVTGEPRIESFDVMSVLRTIEGAALVR